MRMRWLVAVALFLTGCGPERQLQYVEKRLARTQTRLTELQDEVARREIFRIRKELALFQQGLWRGMVEKEDPLFVQEREILSRIIHRNRASAGEARSVLDEILALITVMSNVTSECSVRLETQ